MTSTNVKAMVAKMFTVGFLAAALVMMAPAKAQAQWSVGVRVGPASYYGQGYGRPVVVAPAPDYGYYGQGYYGQGYYGQGYDGQGYDEDRREAFYRHERHEREEREEHFDRDRYNRDDHRDFREHDRH